MPIAHSHERRTRSGGIFWPCLIALLICSASVISLQFLASRCFPEVLKSVAASPGGGPKTDPLPASTPQQTLHALAAPQQPPPYQATPAPTQNPIASQSRPLGNWSTSVSLPSDASKLAGVRLTTTGLRPGSLVECQAICDHHYVYTHSGRADSSGSVGWFIPLRSDHAGFWAAYGHKGNWSAWETVGLRSLVVKGFGSDAPVVKTELVPLATGTGIALEWAKPVNSAVELGRRYELLFDLDGWSGNPFASEEMECKLTVLSPDGSTLSNGAFLFQDFELLMFPDGERLRPYGQKHWRARFRPHMAGRHKATLSVRCGPEARPVTLYSGDFEVTAGTAPDYLVVSKSNPYWFSRTSGKGFYPLGWNIPFATDNPQGVRYVDYTREQKSLGQYLRMLDDAAESGCNTVGMWLSQGWCGLEGPEGSGDYQGDGKYNLRHAWMLDRIMERAEQKGLSIILDLDNAIDSHRTYYRSRHDTRRPYVRDQELTGGHMNQLLYLIALIGDTPALHSWNYLAEADLTSIPDSYILSVLRFIRSRDPYRHIVSNHLNTAQSKPSLTALPEIGFLHFNAYTYPGSAKRFPHEDQIFAIRDASIMYGDLRKPVVVKEYGGHYVPEGAEKMERDVIHGVWGAICSRLSSGPFTWWWEFCYGDDLGRFYKVAADFVRDEDLLREDSPPLGPWRNRSDTVTPANLSVLSVGNATKRFAYVFHTGAVTRDHLSPKWVSDAVLTVDGLQKGPFVVQIWNPRAGRETWTHRFQSDGVNAVTVTLPRFCDAMAVKIRQDTANDAVAPIAAAPTRPKTETKSADSSANPASRWSWRIVPQFSPPQSLSDLCRFEARIALPPELRGSAPRVLRPDGTDLPATQWMWKPLHGGAGWWVSVDSRIESAVQVLAAGRTSKPAAAPDEWPGRGIVSEWLDNVSTNPESLDNLRGLAHDSRRAAAVPLKQLFFSNNPAGQATDFATWIRAPLLIPESGTYRTDGSANDDLAGARIDGHDFLAWDAERTRASSWSRGSRRQRGTDQSPSARELRLQAGLHLIEAGFWQDKGALRFQLGLSHDKPSVRFGGLDSPLSIWEEGVPPWFVDGRIPCRQEIVRDGKTVATILPALGLRVRKPHRLLHQTRWLKGQGIEEECLFSTESGWRDDLAGAQGIPVWAENDHHLPISLLADGGVLTDGKRFVRARLVGQKLPLRLIESSSDGRRGPTRSPDATEGEWAVWHISSTLTTSFQFELAGAAVESELVFGDDRVERSVTQPWRSCLSVGGEAGRLSARTLPAGRGARLPDELSPTPLPADTALWPAVASAKGCDRDVGVLIFVRDSRTVAASDALHPTATVERWISEARRLGWDPILVDGPVPDRLESEGVTPLWLRRFSQVNGVPVLDPEGGRR